MKNISTQHVTARLKLESQLDGVLICTGFIPPNSSGFHSLENKTGIRLENNKEYHFHIAVKQTEEELWYEAIELVNPRFNNQTKQP